MGTIVKEISPLVPVHYTRIEVTYNSNNDVFVYKNGVDTVGTITVTYTSTAKTDISTVVRT